MKKEALKSSGQSRHERHYNFIKSQDSEVRCAFRVITECPRMQHAWDCLRTVLLHGGCKYKAREYPECCNCVCRTVMPICDVRGKDIMWLFRQLCCLMSV